MKLRLFHLNSVLMTVIIILAYGLLMFSCQQPVKAVGDEATQVTPVGYREGDLTTSIPHFDFNDSPIYEVIRIIDGDTVKVSINGETTTIRLIGVDTPETVHPSKPVEAFGKEASMFLDNLLKGEEVNLLFEQGVMTKDKYGRTLAYLFRCPDGLFVNLEIVRQGYGHAYVQYPFEHMSLFEKYEDKARDVGKGLWRDADVGDIDEVQTIEIITPVSEPDKTEIEQAPPEKQKDPKDSITVYITRTGAKYHRGNCRYLSKSKIPISLADAISRGFGPCSVCNPPR